MMKTIMELHSQNAEGFAVAAASPFALSFLTLYIIISILKIFVNKMSDRNIISTTKKIVNTKYE